MEGKKEKDTEEMIIEGYNKCLKSAIKNLKLCLSANNEEDAMEDFKSYMYWFDSTKDWKIQAERNNVDL